MDESYGVLVKAFQQDFSEDTEMVVVLKGEDDPQGNNSVLLVNCSTGFLANMFLEIIESLDMDSRLELAMIMQLRSTLGKFFGSSYTDD